MDLMNEEVILEFLKLYESEPVLWNPKHRMHKNRGAVIDAWKRIRDSLSIECSIEELKKKKDSLMATFRPLLKKVNKSRKLGSGREVYKPMWFAFDQMASFLRPVYKMKPAINAEEESSADEGKKQGEVQDEEVTEARSMAEDTCLERVSGKRLSPQARKEYRKRKLSKVETIEAQMMEAYKVMKTVSKRTSKEKDFCDLYSDLLAVKLRDFDELNRIIVMNEIDNLIFRAKMQSQDPLRTGPSTFNGQQFVPTKCASAYTSRSPQASRSSSPSAASRLTATPSPSPSRFDTKS